MSPGRKQVQNSRHRRVVRQWGHTRCTLFHPLWTVTTHMKHCLPGKLIKYTVARGFSAGWSCRQPVPSTYQNSRLPQGKRYSDSWGMVSHSYSFSVQKTAYHSSSQILAKGQPCKQPLEVQWPQACYANYVLHTNIKIFIGYNRPTLQYCLGALSLTTVIIYHIDLYVFFAPLFIFCLSYWNTSSGG